MAARYFRANNLTSELATMIGSAIGAAATVIAVIVATHYSEHRQQARMRAYIAAIVFDITHYVRVLRLRLRLHIELVPIETPAGHLPSEGWVVALKANRELVSTLAKSAPRIRRLQDHAHNLDLRTVFVLNDLEERIDELRALTEEIHEISQYACLYGGPVPDEVMNAITRHYAAMKALLITLDHPLD